MRRPSGERITRLSWPLAKLRPHYQVVVVGSGYGGAIAAARLARDGRDVCVLERGWEFQPGDFPDRESAALRELQFDSPSHHRLSQTGLYDIRVNDEIDVLLGCGLGGTSLINANVAETPHLSVFQHSAWPGGLSADLGRSLSNGFADAVDMLRPARYPQDQPGFRPLPKMRALQRIHEALHAHHPAYKEATFRPLSINVNFEQFPGDLNHVGVRQTVCRLCGDCMSGCNYGAKNTVMMNYLPYAAAHGAAIFTGITVRSLSRHEGRWVVHLRLSAAGREKFTGPEMFVTADRVVLAAGTLGTTEILKRSADRLTLSAQLGRRFTGNGDYLAFGYNSDDTVKSLGAGRGAPDVFEPVGPCTAALIDLRNAAAGWEQGIVIEEGVAAGAASRLLPTALAVATLLAGRPTDIVPPRRLRRDAARLWRHFRGREAAEHTLIFLIMAHDDGQGRLELRDDRIRIDWSGVSRQEIFERIRARLREASAVSRSVFLPNPLRLVTAHPLGGCCMANDAEHGVVNHKGQVFQGATGEAAYPTLYVCDGSIIPRPLGINPLLTISALAERTCALLRDDWPQASSGAA